MKAVSEALTDNEMDKELYKLLLDEKEAVEKAMRAFQTKMLGTRIEGEKAELICILSFLRVQHVGALTELMRMISDESVRQEYKRQGYEN